jgi:hypothetical protein
MVYAKLGSLSTEGVYLTFSWMLIQWLWGGINRNMALKGFRCLNAVKTNILSQNQSVFLLHKK